MMVVFIAIPSKGIANEGQLTVEFLQKLAELHVKYPGCSFIAPMVQDYQLLKHIKTTATWEDWGKHCKAIIPRCDEVWVLQYDGWDTSVGVAAEIECARENKVPVRFVGVR